MDLRLFAGRSNEKLARDIARYINSKSEFEGKTSVLGELDSRRNFRDGELYVRFGTNVRGRDVFIIQSTNQPDSHLTELNSLIHTAKLASAGRITAVIPYFGYARQDWKDKSRAPIMVARIAREIGLASGVDRVIFLDVHSNVTPGVFAALNIQTDHLWARPEFVKYLKNNLWRWRSERKFVVAAPDVHAANLAQAYAKDLGAESFVVIGKRRPKPGDAEVSFVLGEVSGQDVLIVDDIIDSGGTIINAAEVLRERGAADIYALTTHGVFSENSVKRLQNSLLKFIFVTDSIAHVREITLRCPKFNVVSVAGLLGEAILRTHNNESVSSLFEGE